MTLDGSHMHRNKQKDLKVMLEPKRLCTLLPGTHCILRFFYLPAGAFDCNKVRSSQSGLVSPGLQSSEDVQLGHTLFSTSISDNAQCHPQY